ncbi:MAG TPA: CheR family methyltransferase, partial [Pyrinomonadaceae bacterium]
MEVNFTPPALKASEFAQIRQLAYRKFGLDIKEGKQSLIVTRLSKELRRLGLTTFEQYCRHVTSDHSGEALIEMADALTTNFTSFMREQAHFQFLRKELSAQLPRSGPVDIWSAASSTGEEPYSILFTLLETLGPSADVRILATDISTRALRAGTDAVYEAAKLATLPP